MSKCPYCNVEISETSIENEDGCCPECGALLSAPDLGMGDDNREDEFDEEDQDIFDDLDEDVEFQHDDGFGDEDFGDLDDEFDDEEFDDEELEEDDF